MSHVSSRQTRQALHVRVAQTDRDPNKRTAQQRRTEAEANFLLSQSCERSSVAFDGVQYLPPFQFIERERKTNCKLARYTFSVARASKVAAAAATTAIQSCPGDATSMGSWHAETAN